MRGTTRRARVAGSARRLALAGGQELAHLRQRLDLLERLVVADGGDPGEAEGDAGGEPDGALDAVELHFDDDAGLDRDVAPALPRLEGEEALGHRRDLGVGQPFDRLAD